MRERVLCLGRSISVVIRPILSEIRYNLGLSGRNAIFDGTLLLCCAGFFFFNDLLIKPSLSEEASSGAIAYFATCHLNDLLGGVAFLAYTNMLLDLVRPDVRIRRLSTCILYIFFCGVFWEVVTPNFVARSVSDPFDMLAYIVGAFIYGVLYRAVAFKH